MTFLSRITAPLHQIVALLQEILAELRPGRAVGFIAKVKDRSTGEIRMYEGDFSMFLTRNSRRHVKITPMDAPENGNPTTLDGKLSVVSENPAVRIENLSEDGLEFDLVSGSQAGSGPITLKGDADRTEAVRDIVGNIDITVPAGDAVVLMPQVGEEVPNP